MRLSTKGRYATRAMIHLALKAKRKTVSREEIAAGEDVSAEYLARLLAKLVKAGLVSSVKGPGGGYVLARDRAAITVGQIIRAVEEPLAPVFCVDARPVKTCPRMDGCPARPLWGRLGKRIEEFLDSVTLEELCAQAQSERKDVA